MTEELIKKNKVVSITYVIRDDKGDLMEQSDLPITYIHGVDKRMFDEIVAMLEGGKMGDEVELTLTPEQAFGMPDPELTYSDDIENVPAEYQHIGAEAMFENDNGETMSMTVVKIEDGMISLDGNHPFAGKTIVFSLKVVGVRDATAEELASGEAAADVTTLMH